MNKTINRSLTTGRQTDDYKDKWGVGEEGASVFVRATCANNGQTWRQKDGVRMMSSMSKVTIEDEVEQISGFLILAHCFFHLGLCA
jgi:hypothetical protein